MTENTKKTIEIDTETMEIDPEILAEIQKFADEHNLSLDDAITNILMEHLAHVLGMSEEGIEN